MGHLINPIAVRLGLNYTWESVWVNQFKFKSRKLVGKDLVLHKYLRVLINRKRLWKTGVFVSHYRIFRLKHKAVVLLYIYDGSVKLLLRLARKFLRKLLLKYNKIWYRKRLKIKYLRRYTSVMRHKIALFYIKRYYRTFGFIKRLLILYYKLWVTRKIKNKIEPNVSCFVLGLAESQLSSSSIANYVAIKLRQHFKLKSALNPVLNLLNNNKFLVGYKIQCSGRFRRKEMAERLVFAKGKVSLNTFSAKVDYSMSTVVLKYSVCGIKVWLNFKNLNQKYKFVC